MPLPATVNLECYRGDTWSQTFRFLSNGQPIDLTGAAAACEAQRSELRGTLAATVGPNPGEVTIQMDAVPLEPGPWQYDLEIDKGGVVQTLVRGRLIVERDVTHAAA